MKTQFAWITEVARRKPQEKFTSLVYLINEQSLTESHAMLKTGKASGIDKVTKEEYGRNLEANIRNLVGRMKTQAYKPQAAR